MEKFAVLKEWKKNWLEHNEKRNKMKQTAVEWLVEQYENNFPLTFDAIEQAKQIEKEQIESAFNYGQFDLGMEANEYYNETFKNEKQ